MLKYARTFNDWPRVDRQLNNRDDAIRNEIILRQSATFARGK